MLRYTQAVSRAVKRAMVITDMPFMSFQLSEEAALRNASRFIKEGGAQAVKIEGSVYLKNFKTIIDAGIPVMGHLGFTPQLVNQIGGYKVQGKTKNEAKLILEAARALEKIGSFAIVLEMVPAELAKKVRDSVKIPVIGCGAGPHCDGQVLVTHDILGLYPNPPKFAKRYANLGAEIKKAVGSYIREVKSGKFPSP
jgi:3-methyl-2-oxobutanoate hydroxymethyltransferase